MTRRRPTRKHRTRERRRATRARMTVEQLRAAEAAQRAWHRSRSSKSKR